MTIQRLISIVPNNPVPWIIAGLMGAMIGAATDAVVSGEIASEAAKWGGFGALVGCAVGLMGVAGKLSMRR